MGEGTEKTARVRVASRVVRRVALDAIALNQGMVRCYSKLPLAGRSWIRWTYSSVKAAQSRTERVKAYCTLAGTVAVMTAGHATAAYFGTLWSAYRVSEVAAAPSVARVALAALDCAYTLGNAGAIHAQLSVAARATRMLRTTAVPVTTVSSPVYEPRISSLARDSAFTLAAHGAFVASIFLGA